MRIIPNQGICDPHIRIYNGRVYMYAWLCSFMKM